MAEQARKHELVVVVGVRNIEQREQQESQTIEPTTRRRAIEVNETSSNVEITYENDRIQLDEGKQTGEQEDEHTDQQFQYYNMEQKVRPLEAPPQQIPEAATRLRRQRHHLEELAEDEDEEQQQQQQEVDDTGNISHSYENEDHHHGSAEFNQPDSNRPTQQVTGADREVALEQQLGLLRDLLRIERHNSEQRRHNNHVLQKYIDQLQADYLRQQSDLVQALEFSHKLKGQKESQLECLEASLRQKESHIGQLNVKLASLDEFKLRDELKQALDKQAQLKQVEHDQLRAQMLSMEQRLVGEQTRCAHQADQFQAKLDEQMRLHAKELELARARLVTVQEDLERVLSEPQNLVIRALREDKSHLGARAEELQLALEETQSKYDSIKRRLDELLAEQKRASEQHQVELQQAQAQHGEQRRALQELKLELEDKDEVNQILQFNLSRSEKRVRNLLGSLKAKEAAYRELIGAHEAKHQHETERLKSALQEQEKKLLDCESELGKKQNELVRLQLEQENQLESLRNDRDERLKRMTQEKSTLERDQQATELRCARELELARETGKQVDQLRGELEQLREEGKRISIELTKSEAKLYAKQQELNQVNGRVQELEQQRATNEVGSSEQQVARLTRELDVERNLSKRLRTHQEELGRENEKLCVKLKIAETNVDQMSSVLRREHAKMMLEYERKLEQIRSEQVVFDRNKLRYKRYGYKLKRYCEHLRRVHEHLCSPANCGYAISSPGQDFRGASEQRGDRVSLLSCGAGDSDESQDGYEEIYEEIDYAADGASVSRIGPTSHTTEHSPDKFLIKRTGGMTSPQQQQQQQQQCKLKTSKPATRDAASRQHQQYPRTPLKPKNQLTEDKDLFARASPTGPDQLKRPARPSSWQANQTENRDDRHAYYYIRTDGKPQPSPLGSNPGGRRTSLATAAAATSRSLTPAACRQTKLSLARAKVRQQKQQQHPEPKLCRAVI